MVKRILLGMVLLLLMVTVGCCQEPEKPLQLTIKSDKQVYEVGEPIYIDYEITNVDSEEITIAPPFDDNGIIDPHRFGGAFIIKRELDETSTEVYPLANFLSMPITPDKVITLKKGESYNKKVNIIKISEGSDDTKSIPYSSEMFFQREGKYTIQGKYEWSKLRKNYPTPNCWKGIFLSNTITIEVVEKK